MNSSNHISALGLTASIWGIAGFFVLIAFALVNLSRISLDALTQPFSPLQWAVLLINIVFMAYSEGYKGFQKSYSPRLAARAKYLAKHSSVFQCIFAPLFCMGFFHAPKKRIITSVLLFIMIVIFVLSFRLLPQPWRGILDAGVVVGLTWGLIATAHSCLMAFTQPQWQVDPEVQMGQKLFSINPKSV